ncbi:MAG TPA: hypothetical protein ENI15_07890 [Spirochaetes bacterium]|nr:hypothetical protein [Spirochaetota bacterium]
MSQMLLCSGTSWAAILERKREWLDETPGKTIFIMPPEFSADAVRETFKDSLSDFSFYTNEEFIQHFLRQPAGKGRDQHALLSKQAVDYLLAAIISDTPAEPAPDGGYSTPSRYLNIETQRHGYVRALGEFIYDFRRTHHEELLPTLTAFSNGELSARDRDLIDIHDEYENLIDGRGLFDYRRGVLYLLQNQDEEVSPAIQKEMEDSTLILMGFSYLGSLDYKLLRWAVGRFKRSIVLTCRNPKAPQITFRVQNALEGLLKELKTSMNEEVEEKTLACKAGPSLMPLAELSFNDGIINRLPADFAPRVQITRANTRYHEVNLIARTIRKLNEEKVPWSNIRAVFPGSEVYTALVLEIFPRYKIPYRLSKGIPLKFFPLAGTIQNLISQAINPYPFPLREEIFSSPYVSFSCEVNAEKLNGFRNSIGEEIPVNMDMIGTFLPQPRKVCLDFSRILELQLIASQAVKTAEKLLPVQRVLRYIKERYAEKPSIQNQEILKTLENYYVLSMAEKSLYLWRFEMTPEAFCRAVRKLFKRFQIEENAAQARLKANEISSHVLDQDKRILQTIYQLLEKLQAYFLLLSSTREQKFPLLELIRAFSGFMSDPELSVPLPDTEGIAISSAADTPALFRPFTIIGGLIDGEFPAREPFNFLKPKRNGQTLRGNFSLIDKERQNLYQIISCTTNGLFIFFPASDGGKKLMVSPFVAEIEKCLPERKKTSKNEALYTFREKLIFATRNIDRAHDRALPVLKELERISADRYQQIVKVFRCDGLRAGLKGFSRFDGIFQSPAGPNLIREEMGGYFVYNAEKLERYAGCPLRYLFDDLMCLRPDYLIDYHPDKTERGQLIRRILIDYSEGAAPSGKDDQGRPGLDEAVHPGMVSGAAEILYKITEQALSKPLKEKDDLFSRRFKHGLLTGLKSSDSSTRKRPGLLVSFLEYDRDGPDLLDPYLAKLSYGKREEFKVAGVPLNIDIERVDITSDSRYLIVYSFSICDHGYVQGIRKGLRFKLPLEVLALRAYVEKNNLNKTVGGAGTYLVKNPRNIKRGGYFALKELQATRTSKVSDSKPLFSGQRRYGFLPEPVFEKELENTASRVRQITGLIHRGRFNPPLCAVKDQTCLNCRFLRICRKDQLRLDKLYTLVDGDEVYKPLRRME